MSVFPNKDRLGNVWIMFLSVAASKSSSQAKSSAFKAVTHKGELRVGVDEGESESSGRQKEELGSWGLFLDREFFTSLRGFRSPYGQ